MSLKTLSIEQFTLDLGSNKSMPGGGAATALVGSMAVALGNMSAKFTVGKKKYAEYDDEIRSLIEKLDSLTEVILDLIDRDVEAFEPLSRAYKLPSESDEEKKIKHEKMQEGLKIAASVPIKVFEVCYESFDILLRLSEISSKLLVSDVGVGANFLFAALSSSVINVEVNLSGIDDEDYVLEIREMVKNNISKSKVKLDKINEIVFRRL